VLAATGQLGMAAAGQIRLAVVNPVAHSTLRPADARSRRRSHGATLNIHCVQATSAGGAVGRDRCRVSVPAIIGSSRPSRGSRGDQADCSIGAENSGKEDGRCGCAVRTRGKGETGADPVFQGCRELLNAAGGCPWGRHWRAPRAARGYARRFRGVPEEADFWG
jgi:hypothetical protein